MVQIIKSKRSLMVDCDVADLSRFKELIRDTRGVKGVESYKLGLALTVGYGLPRLIEIARESANHQLLIPDLQKFMTDIPRKGRMVLQEVKAAGADAIIGVPLSGPETQRAYIEAAGEIGLPIIVGGHMTHPKFLASEGGYIYDGAPVRMYELSAQLGVNNFVVPGNLVGMLHQYRAIVKKYLKEPMALWAPGFGEQGGSISQALIAAGDESFHAIIGSAIYNARDMQASAAAFVEQLRK